MLSFTKSQASCQAFFIIIFIPTIVKAITTLKSLGNKIYEKIALQTEGYVFIIEYAETQDGNNKVRKEYQAKGDRRLLRHKSTNCLQLVCRSEQTDKETP